MNPQRLFVNHPVRWTAPNICSPFVLAGLLFAGTQFATANQVTYQVNLGVQRTLGHFNPANGDTVVVSGTFSSTDWTTTSALTAGVADSNIYSGTFNNNVPTGNTENHKFIINPGGNSPANQLLWESDANRFFQVAAADQTLPVVYFDNMTTSAATAHITFLVNLEAEAASGNFNPVTDSVSVSGDSLNDWSTTASPLTNSPLQPNIWRGTFSVTTNIGGTVSYRFVKHPQAGGNNWENDAVGPGGTQNRQLVFSGSDITLPLVDFNNVPPATEFIAGADMSHLIFFEDRGTVYRQAGEARDALTLLTNFGINCVRLRLFTSSAAQAQADPYNGINNLTYNLPLAVRVKNAGLKFLLDFHYSDSWADPGKQTKPSTWTNLNFADLKSQIRSYSSNSIATFAAVGAMPDYVQVGNEITPGLLWNDGRVGGSYDTANQWSQLAQLLTSAVQGIKDAAGAQMPKIVIHIDRGGDWAGTRWYFDNLIQRQVPFDIIGESYYPWWHGSPAALATCLTNAANRYGKTVMVMETAFPRSDSTNIFGIPATTNGQVQFVTELAKIVKSVPGGKGIGIFWWGTEYQQLSGYSLAGFDRRSFFGTDGGILPVAEAFGALTAPVRITPSLSNNTLILRWPLSGAGMALETSTNLAPAAWTNATNAILSTGSVFTTQQSMDGGTSHFYRLQSN
jgi:arabinogalactan endo-1,4-beta-galactosidase